MIYCRFCGHQEADASTFCGACGQSLSSYSEPSSMTDDPCQEQTALKNSDPDTTLIVQPPEADDRNNASHRQTQEVALLPLPGQQPSAGQIPALQGTPQAGHISTISGTPQSASPQSTPDPAGSAPQTGHADSPPSAGHADSTAQQAHAPQTPGSQHGPAHAKPVTSSTHSARAHQHTLHQAGKQLRRLRHLRHAAPSTGTATGTASAAIATKVIVTVVIVASIAASSVIAVPRLLQHATQTGSQVLAKAVPMPPTRTSCPAPGAGRPEITRPLNPGNHQALLFIDDGKLERFDSNTGKTTTILQTPTLSEAQISPDGTWVAISDQVGNQAAIQLIRLDGQGRQTLHCSPAGQSIFNLSWSPDQQHIAFNEGVRALHGPFAESGNANTYLLQLKTGTLQRLLIASSPDQVIRVGYFPFVWLDNTHLYLSLEIICCNGVAYIPYQININQGPDQPESNLHAIFASNIDPSIFMTLSPDRRSLFFVPRFPTPNGVSDFVTLFKQPSTGGDAQAIYTEHSSNILSIEDVAAIDANNLLMVEDASNEVSSLWKLNLVSGQKTPVIASIPSTLSFTAPAPEPWKNISRDGTMYVIMTSNINDATAPVAILVGSLQGRGSPRTLASLANAQDRLFPVGWATL